MPPTPTSISILYSPSPRQSSDSLTMAVSTSALSKPEPEHRQHQNPGRYDDNRCQPSQLLFLPRPNRLLFCSTPSMSIFPRQHPGRYWRFRVLRFSSLVDFLFVYRVHVVAVYFNLHFSVVRSSSLNQLSSLMLTVTANFTSSPEWVSSQLANGNIKCRLELVERDVSSATLSSAHAGRTTIRAKAAAR